MKLRWMDTKSKRLQEVCLDLEAILNDPNLRTVHPLERQPSATQQFGSILPRTALNPDPNSVGRSRPQPGC